MSYIKRVKNTANQPFNLRDSRLGDGEELNIIKDWSVNDTNSSKYITNRTHYTDNRFELIDPTWNGAFISENAPINTELNDNYVLYNTSKFPFEEITDEALEDIIVYYKPQGGSTQIDKTLKELFPSSSNLQNQVTERNTFRGNDDFKITILDANAFSKKIFGTTNKYSELIIPVTNTPDDYTENVMFDGWTVAPSYMSPSGINSTELSRRFCSFYNVGSDLIRRNNDEFYNGADLDRNKVISTPKDIIFDNGRINIYSNYQYGSSGWRLRLFDTNNNQIGPEYLFAGSSTPGTLYTGGHTSILSLYLCKQDDAFYLVGPYHGNSIKDDEDNTLYNGSYMGNLKDNATYYTILYKFTEEQNQFLLEGLEDPVTIQSTRYLDTETENVEEIIYGNSLKTITLYNVTGIQEVTIQDSQIELKPGIYSISLKDLSTATNIHPIKYKDSIIKLPYKYIPDEVLNRLSNLEAATGSISNIYATIQYVDNEIDTIEASIVNITSALNDKMDKDSLVGSGDFKLYKNAQNLGGRALIAGDIYTNYDFTQNTGDKVATESQLATKMDATKRIFDELYIGTTDQNKKRVLTEDDIVNAAEFKGYFGRSSYLSSITATEGDYAYVWNTYQGTTDEPATATKYIYMNGGWSAISPAVTILNTFTPTQWRNINTNITNSLQALQDRVTVLEDMFNTMFEFAEGQEF